MSRRPTSLSPPEPHKAGVAVDGLERRQVAVAARTMQDVHTTTSCSVAACAEVITGKWTALIVHDLSEGPRRFGALEHSCPGISPQTLSDRLRALEADGIVLRHSYPESPPRVEYELTEKGKSLLPIVGEMRRFGREWGLVHDHGHTDDDAACRPDTG